MNTTTTEKPASLAALQAQVAAPREAALPTVSPGFGSLQSFELMQRAAKLLTASDLVPAQYRAVIEKKNYKGEVTSSIENPRALANAVVALNMAQRMNADPLMVMQNLYVVEGRPSWSAQWVIAAINASGKFSPLRFDMTDAGEKVTECVTFEWSNGDRQRKVQAVTHRDVRCRAWVIERETGERLEGPEVSIEIAVKEGWYTKNGSKWQTIPDLMLRYRAAAFFGRLYAPEILMGLQTDVEMQDVVDVTRQPDGSYAADLGTLRGEPPVAPAAAVVDAEPAAAAPAPAPAAAAEPAATPAPAPAAGPAADGPDLDELFPPPESRKAPPAPQGRQRRSMNVD